MAQATNMNTNSEKSAENMGFKMPNVDFNAIMDSYKKNLEILGLINKMSVEVCNGITKLQAAFVKQMVADMGGIMEKCGKPSEAFAKMSEVARDNTVNAINNSKQISEMLTAAGNEITKTITTRMRETMEEAKKMAK